MIWHDILTKVPEEWSEFLHSKEVNCLSSGNIEIPLANICFDSMCRKWAKRMVRKYAPNDQENALKAICHIYNIQ